MSSLEHLRHITPPIPAHHAPDPSPSSLKSTAALECRRPDKRLPPGLFGLTNVSFTTSFRSSELIRSMCRAAGNASLSSSLPYLV